MPRLIVICAARRMADTAGRCRTWLDERMPRPGGRLNAFSETGGVTASGNPGTAATITKMMAAGDDAEAAGAVRPCSEGQNPATLGGWPRQK